jgi:hypothetical protein
MQNNPNFKNLRQDSIQIANLNKINFILHYMPSAEIPYIHDETEPDKIIYSKKTVWIFNTYIINLFF